MQTCPPELELTSPDHPALRLLPDVPTRDEIEAFGQMLERLEGEHGAPDIGTAHHVNEDLYGRSIVLPAGAFLVGLAHKRPGFAVCVGDITVWTERGRERLTGAHILQTVPGLMRVGFAHADTTWFTVHSNPTGAHDRTGLGRIAGHHIEAIEDALVEHADRLMTRRRMDAAHYLEIA